MENDLTAKEIIPIKEKLIKLNYSLIKDTVITMINKNYLNENDMKDFLSKNRIDNEVFIMYQKKQLTQKISSLNVYNEEKLKNKI